MPTANTSPSTTLLYTQHPSSTPDLTRARHPKRTRPSGGMMSAATAAIHQPQLEGTYSTGSRRTLPVHLSERDLRQDRPRTAHGHLDAYPDFASRPSAHACSFRGLERSEFINISDSTPSPGISKHRSPRRLVMSAFALTLDSSVLCRCCHPFRHVSTYPSVNFKYLKP